MKCTPNTAKSHHGPITEYFISHLRVPRRQFFLRQQMVRLRRRPGAVLPRCIRCLPQVDAVARAVLAQRCDQPVGTVGGRQCSRGRRRGGGG